MLKLEYVGNKPLISAKGINFSANKLDKYEYIEPAIHILEVFLDLSDENNDQKINPNSIYSQDKIIEILKKAKPDFDKIYETKIEDYKKHLTQEKADVDKDSHLSEEEKDTLRNNFMFMENYRIQRATNKIVYEEIINSSVDLILKKGISIIKTPFSVTFLHVLGSLETTLLQQKSAPRKISINAKLDKENPYSEMAIEF